MASPPRSVRVLYHHPCIDGMFAAWAAQMHFSRIPGLDLQYVPHTTRRDLSPEVFNSFPKNAEVYMVDYCGPASFIPSLAPRVQRVVLIDHHKTAADLVTGWRASNSIPDNVEINLDMEHSGATLSYAYFAKLGELVPADKRERIEKLFAYVEDHDLFLHKLPFSKEFNSGINARTIEADPAKHPGLWAELDSLDPSALIQVGQGIIAGESAIIDAEIAGAFPIKLGGAEKNGVFGTCLAVITEHSDLRSEMGNRLAARSKAAGHRAMAGVLYLEDPPSNPPPADWKPAVYRFSLRSIGDEDTTAISTAFGGGGHKNASSFTFPISALASWRV
jgi:hypothetical protein